MHNIVSYGYKNIKPQVKNLACKDMDLPPSFLLCLTIFASPDSPSRRVWSSHMAQVEPLTPWQSSRRKRPPSFSRTMILPLPSATSRRSCASTITTELGGVSPVRFEGRVRILRCYVEANESVWDRKCSRFFPMVEWLDPQGLKRKMKKKSGNGKDEPANLSQQDIYIFILELFMAGSETTSSTIEWAFTELLCNPKTMIKSSWFTRLRLMLSRTPFDWQSSWPDDAQLDLYVFSFHLEEAHCFVADNAHI
ncbi:hypothetical protein F3Y22_tig00109980pilonHSYRG00139 [Hibiscus syriacus]|uniref:Uncharacterized protein n=1 Tax=Hibiscus syriacus TaxID=106335 RepID=A0A6A3BSW6_HIBSY|nr:hypothetical protein F3Y22_tig00109980pilonHSYRG00139 [Hibiscus syriacus]